MTVDLLALFGAAPAHVQFRFVAEDVGVGSLVEAAVDDFEILGLPQNPVSVPDENLSDLALGPPLPNPSRAGVRLRLSLPRSAEATATVRDLQGRLVRRLAPGTQRPAGVSWIEWDGRASSGLAAPAGLYWLEVRVGAEVLRRKLVRVAF